MAGRHPGRGTGKPVGRMVVPCDTRPNDKNVEAGCARRDTRGAARGHRSRDSHAGRVLQARPGKGVSLAGFNYFEYHVSQYREDKEGVNGVPRRGWDDLLTHWLDVAEG